MTESEKEYIGERVKCEFCNNEYSKQNIKRHQKTCSENPVNKRNPITDYEKGKEIHKPTQIGTPLNQMNKDLNKNSKKDSNKRENPLDYEQLSKNIEKCKYCNQQFHPSGLPKHEQYCEKNPNAKNGYGTKRKWECRYCSALFLHQKERDLHESRCENTIEANEKDNFDRLRNLKRLFPEVYELLTPEQITKFIDGELIKNE